MGGLVRLELEDGRVKHGAGPDPGVRGASGVAVSAYHAADSSPKWTRCRALCAENVPATQVGTADGLVWGAGCLLCGQVGRGTRTCCNWRVGIIL